MRAFWLLVQHCCALWVTGLGRKFARIFADMSLFCYTYFARQVFVVFELPYMFRGFGRVRQGIMYWLSTYKQSKVRRKDDDFIGLVPLAFLALWDVWCLVYLRIIAVVIYSYVSFYSSKQHAHFLQYVGWRANRKILLFFRGYRQLTWFKRFRVSTS